MAIPKARLGEFVRTYGQLKAVGAAVGKLHTADATLADKPISDLQLPVTNRLLKGASDFLAAESPFRDALTLPLAAPPNHGDVLLLVEQLLSGFETYRLQHIQLRHGRWYWLVQKDGEPDKVEYAPVDPMPKPAEAD